MLHPLFLKMDFQKPQKSFQVSTAWSLDTEEFSDLKQVKYAAPKLYSGWKGKCQECSKLIGKEIIIQGVIKAVEFVESKLVEIFLIWIKNN